MKKKEKNLVARHVHDFFIALCINIVRPRYQILSSMLFVSFFFLYLTVHMKRFSFLKNDLQCILLMNMTKVMLVQQE